MKSDHRTELQQSLDHADDDDDVADDDIEELI
jgi:hypothetical protein